MRDVCAFYSRRTIRGGGARDACVCLNRKSRALKRVFSRRLLVSVCVCIDFYRLRAKNPSTNAPSGTSMFLILSFNSSLFAP